MDESLFPHWFLWVAIGWLAFIVLLSVLVRKSLGKSIVPKVPLNAIYAEKRASGRMARNSLIVAVTPEALTVVPKFPFNLMFLPQIYRLEHTIPIAAIRDVTLNSNRWGNNVNLTYGPHGHALGLKVRDPEALVAALKRLRSA